jgi:hypothetical protein
MSFAVFATFWPSPAFPSLCFSTVLISFCCWPVFFLILHEQYISVRMLLHCISGSLLPLYIYVILHVLFFYSAPALLFCRICSGIVSHMYTSRGPWGEDISKWAFLLVRWEKRYLFQIHTILLIFLSVCSCIVLISFFPCAVFCHSAPVRYFWQSASHSWALTDWSVTSGTGLTMMPECRCRTKRRKLTEN